MKFGVPEVAPGKCSLSYLGMWSLTKHTVSRQDLECSILPLAQLPLTQHRCTFGCSASQRLYPKDTVGKGILCKSSVWQSQLENRPNPFTFYSNMDKFKVCVLHNSIANTKPAFFFLILKNLVKLI